MKEQKRVTVYMDEEKHRRAKSKLALLGKTLSGWIRELVDKLLEE